MRTIFALFAVLFLLDACKETEKPASDNRPPPFAVDVTMNIIKAYERCLSSIRNNTLDERLEAAIPETEATSLATSTTRQFGEFWVRINANVVLEVTSATEHFVLRSTDPTSPAGYSYAKLDGLFEWRATVEQNPDYNSDPINQAELIEKTVSCNTPSSTYAEYRLQNPFINIATLDSISYSQYLDIETGVLTVCRDTHCEEYSLDEEKLGRQYSPPLELYSTNRTYFILPNWQYYGYESFLVDLIDPKAQKLAGLRCPSC